MKNVAVLTENEVCRYLPSFFVPTPGVWQLKSLLPQEFAIQGKQNAYAWGSPRGGGGEGWAPLELTDNCWTQNTGKVLTDFVSTGLHEYA